MPEEENYGKCRKDELLAWLKKGNGKGNKGPGGKSKGKGFQGMCLYCGVWGHRLNERRKKTADMEKGKGKGAMGDSGWGFPNPGKGKAKGTKGFWNPGKGAWGKGAMVRMQSKTSGALATVATTLRTPFCSSIPSPRRRRTTGKL